MGFILIISMIIRFLSMLTSFLLFHKKRVWQLAFLTLMMGILFCKQSLTLLYALDKNHGGITEFMAQDIPGVVAIELYGLGLSLLFIVFLGPLLVEQEKFQRALRKSEDENRALINAIPDSMLQFDKDGVFLDVKASGDFHRLFSPARFVGKKVGEIFPKKTAVQFAIHIELALQSEEIQIFEYRHEADEQNLTYECRIVAVSKNEAMALVRDITQRKRLEREILEISNREQRRIGQDLHDGLCQHLTGLAFMSEALQRKLAGHPVQDDLKNITASLNQATKQARDLARGLYPLVLENSGLALALEELVANVEKMFGISCVFKEEASRHPAQFLALGKTILKTANANRDRIATDPLQDKQAVLHLYRIVQEAINNALRHGKATQVLIELLESDERIALVIKDNGVGFCEVSENGMGLRIMEYRAQMIGASLYVQSEKNMGTAVTCLL